MKPTRSIRAFRRRSAALALLLPAALLILALPAAAAGTQPPHAAAASAKVQVPVKRPAGVRGDVQQQLDSAERELVALASAVPPEKFSWRPAPGVRSFGEILLHVAEVNYEASAFWGAKTPANVDLKKIQQQGADKGSSIAALRVSFEFVRTSIAGMSDADLERQIEFYGSPSTVRAALLGVVSHAHEHLGQAIAYARMNGIVPPWSAPAPPAVPKRER
jgi:uncharacterized damage-inducible protein DinB